jgi:seryl-tRNA synthetase
MLNLKQIQVDASTIEAALKRRNPDLSLDEISELNGKRISLTQEFEGLRHKQKTLSSVFKGGSPEEIAAARDELQGISARVKELGTARVEVESKLNDLLFEFPNPPAACVPDGASEDENVLVKTVGEPDALGFDAIDHLDLADSLGLVDMERGAKVAGSRFPLYLGAGAQLERALASFMLDVHRGRGYTEILPPFLVNRESMTGTGQLPKFEEDAFTTKDDLFLIPTAEVPVTNMFREEILAPEDLPTKFCAYSSCFRREAGSYGKVTRGLIRVHQFQKVELVLFSKPEESEALHEQLVDDAEEILRQLGLSYRVVELCTGDLGFSARRCFDLEVWLPGQNRYVEISSCSNFGDFQARRAGIRFKRDADSRPEFVHTLNGSGLAVGRTIVALLENGQQADGSVKLPDVLVPYMGGTQVLTPGS